MEQHLDVPASEWWWGGAVADGERAPFGRRLHRRDLATSSGALDDDALGANQSAPLLVSNQGRYVWSERPFTFAFDGAGHLDLVGEDLVVESPARDLSGAFRAAARRFFPATGAPDLRMFSAPQYNTWIEMPYRPTQAGVLAYAEGLLTAGFPPGVLMIDDQWPIDYGTWVFDGARFPDPAIMCDRLHTLGFAVMVWLVPFISPDSANSRELTRRGLLITGPEGGDPVVRWWWNGYSTMLDLGHPDAVDWLREQLHALQTLGVDGFKFDAGDLRDYRPDDVSAGGGSAVDHCEAWARLAAEFAFNELRACWKMGGQPLAQRLHDKPPTWGRGGLASLIPEGIMEGLIGHPFTCPDMIGGGDLAEFADGVETDQELFVRFAQCSALFPMMQFSISPARVLDERHLAAVRSAVELRATLWPELRSLIEHAAASGDPILRPLAFHHPGYEQVRDQFLLGEGLLCAPVLEPGTAVRRVQLPPGSWTRWSGEVDTGPVELEVAVDLDTIPWWRRS